MLRVGSVVKLASWSPEPLFKPKRHTTQNLALEPLFLVYGG